MSNYAFCDILPHVQPKPPLAQLKTLPSPPVGTESGGHWALWARSALGHTGGSGSMSALGTDDCGHWAPWIHERCGHGALWTWSAVGTVRLECSGSHTLWVTDRCPYRRPLSLSRWRCRPPWSGATRPLGGAAGEAAFLRPLAAGAALPPQPGGTNARSKGGGVGPPHAPPASSFPPPSPLVRPPFAPPPRFTLVQSCRSPAPPAAPAPVGAGGASRCLPCPHRACGVARTAPRTVRRDTSRRVRQLSARPEVMRWRQSRSAPRRWVNWPEALPVRPGCGGAAAGAVRGSARLGTARATARAAGFVRGRRAAPQPRQGRLCSGGPAPPPPPPHVRAPRAAAVQRRDSPPGAAGQALPRCRGRGGPGRALLRVVPVGSGTAGPCRAHPTLIPVPRAAVLPSPGVWFSWVFFRSGVRSLRGPETSLSGGGCGRPRSPPGPGRAAALFGCAAFSRVTVERECS